LKSIGKLLLCYDIPSDKRPVTTGGKAIHLRKLKTKIIRLHSIQQGGVLLHTEDSDRITEESLTIHQYLKARKRWTMRTITHVLDENGIVKTGRTEVMNIFTEHMT
jgi:hypothetical protein